MKKIIAGMVFILLLVSLTPLSARAEESSLSVTAYSKFWSKYIGGNGRIFHDAPVSQSGLIIGWGEGYSLDFWGSYPLDGKDGFGKEIDVTLCKATEFGKSWSFEACLAWFHLTPKGFSDIISPQAKLARRFVLSDEHTLTASLEIEFYFPTGKLPTWGVLPEAKLVHSWRVADFLTLNHGPLIKPDHGAFGNDPTVLGGYNAELVWRLNKHLTVQVPMVKFMSPMSKVNDGRKSTTVVGTGLAVSF
ncbi:MAG: hypothetical protein U1C12_02415 [Patescibacteria group bacterium]|nr:hypothetical protein [Patescibacteria group bacterium]